MTIRQSKHPQPTPGLPRSQTVYRVLEPIAGINRSRPPQHLRPNEAWDADNLVLDDGGMRVRSGLSKHAPTLPNAYAETSLLAAHIATTYPGRRAVHEYGFIISGNTPQYYNFSRPSETSYTGQSRWSMPKALEGTYIPADTLYTSSSTSAYFDWTVFNEPVAGAPGQFIRKLVATNGFFAYVLFSGDTIPSNGTALIQSFTSSKLYNVSENSGPIYNPRFIRSIDERLVLFGDIGSSTASAVPGVVQWGVRGDPSQFVGGDSGWALPPNIDGEDTGLAVDNDRLVLFTDRQIWQAAPRRDVFAFDFNLLEDTVGCPYSRTICETRIGVIFLGADLRLYLVSQDSVRVFADTTAILRYATLTDVTSVFAAHDSQQDTYVLFYADDSGHPNRALVLPLTASAPDAPPATTTWTAPGSLRWTNAVTMYDPSSTGTNKPPLSVVMSDGSVYRFLSQQTTDNGTVIVGRYRTPAVSADWSHSMPTELYVDHQSSSTGELQIRYSTDMFSTHSESLASVTMPRTFGGSATLAGTTTTHIPVTLTAARYPQFELRLVGANRISRLQIALRKYSGKHA